MGTVLKALLQQRHWQTVSAFNREYDRIAERIEPEIVGCGPKKAQFYRWLSGDINSLPYPHHCRVLQAMFPEWSVAELFAEYTGASDELDRGSSTAKDFDSKSMPRSRTADVESIYPNRLDFVREMPPQEIFKTARTIDMVGISLNMLCQQYSDTDILRLLESGTAIRCLFLDPTGTYIGQREAEEGHTTGVLSSLTDLNIRGLQRVQRRVREDALGDIQIRTYDAPVRFNITIVDEELCVMQPYLPQARGVESPTFVARKSNTDGIFNTFATVFESMWNDGRETVTG
ncbi:DUF5919 domain-containing protein [Nocardia sp. NPDC049220]|uniref:DUF5919 domain-containing protein n=1 Tax=Nocardia sp. NPDC049220 TaxID=3155273 RepID=UPI0033F88440